MADPIIAKYSKIAILLHWLISVLIISNFVLAQLAEDLTRAAAAVYMDPHKAIGISVLALSMMRLFWRLGHKPPPLPDTVAPWQAKMSKVVHILLYVLMIGVPVTGWLMVAAYPGAPAVDFFGLFNIDLPLPESKGLSGIGNEGHEILTKALFVLFIVHVLAALKHQFFERFPIIQRMLP
jgi:cytochrome b561